MTAHVSPDAPRPPDHHQPRGVTMPFDEAAFTRTAADLVARGDRVPVQRDDPEYVGARLTEKEIELREWLRSQPGGPERWTIIKAGFRRSYDMGVRDGLSMTSDRMTG